MDYGAKVVGNTQLYVLVQILYGYLLESSCDKSFSYLQYSVG